MIVPLPPLEEIIKTISGLPIKDGLTYLVGLGGLAKLGKEGWATIKKIGD